MNQELNDILKNIETMLAILIKRKSDPETEDLIDMEEAARICGLAKRTLYNYVDTGKFRIPFTKKGKITLMKRRDVIQWNADRTFQMFPGLKSS